MRYEMYKNGDLVTSSDDEEDLRERARALNSLDDEGLAEYYVVDSWQEPW